MVATIAKGARVVGQARERLTAQITREYARGSSIREIADAHGRSYGWVHRVLSESGTTLRRRGGAVTKARKK